MREIELEERIERIATITFVRSQGPGGQNVNKVSSKAVARLAIGDIDFLSNGELELLRKRLKNRINSRGEIVLSFQRYRNQLRNRKAVIARMAHLIIAALKAKKRRFPTRPHRMAVERRLDEKRRIGDKKRSRRSLI